MTDYKTVFQLAQDKGYKFYISFEWANQLAADNRETELLVELTLIQKWLRDEHKLFVSISYLSGLFWLELVRDYNTKQLLPISKFHSYESALLEGINEALKLI